MFIKEIDGELWKMQKSNDDVESAWGIVLETPLMKTSVEILGKEVKAYDQLIENVTSWKVPDWPVDKEHRLKDLKAWKKFYEWLLKQAKKLEKKKK